MAYLIINEVFLKSTFIVFVDPSHERVQYYIDQGTLCKGFLNNLVYNCLILVIMLVISNYVIEFLLIQVD